MDDWPQWLSPQRDGHWRETGIVKSFPAGGPPVRWRTPIGAGYTGPAVTGGRVYVTDRVLAKDARNPSNPFNRGVIPGSERVLCLDEATGKILWQHEYECPYDVSYPAGPRATPVVSGGKVWTLGTEGHLLCLDAKDGKVLWSREFKKDFNATKLVYANGDGIHRGTDAGADRKQVASLKPKEPGFGFTPQLVWLLRMGPGEQNSLRVGHGKPRLQTGALMRRCRVDSVGALKRRQRRCDRCRRLT